MQEGKTRYIAVVCAVIFLYANTSLATVPSIVLDYYTTVTIDEAVVIDASKSFDADADELYFTWLFENTVLSTSSILTHTFHVTGEQKLILELSDAVSTSTLSILIEVEQENTQSPNDQDGDMIAIITNPETMAISELMPNPVGSDDAEWIELINYGNEVVDIAGWKLADASGKTYLISGDDISNTRVSPGGFILIPRLVSGIALNNSNETVVLYTTDDREIMRVQYLESAKEGESYARKSGDIWQWTTTPTPLAVNQFTGVPEVVDTTDSDDSENTNHTDDTNTDEEVVVLEDLENNSQMIATGTIVISELYPDPDGDDRLYEFIELHNTSSTTVIVENWTLADPSSEYVFSRTFLVDEYMVFDRSVTDIALNNTGDTITLRGANDALYEEVIYPKAPTGKSYQRISDAWEWADPTPSEGYNSLSSVGTGGPEEISGDTTETSGVEQAMIPALAELMMLDDDVLVTATGVVTAVPGDFDSRTMYVEDQTAGIQIYLHAADWPQVQVGDIVSVVGELRTAYGERRIVLADGHDLEVMAHGTALSPLENACPDFANAGENIAISGTKVSVDGSYVIFNTELCGEIFVKKSNLLSEQANDAIIKMTGIVRIRDDRVYVDLLGIVALNEENSAVATTTQIITDTVTSTYVLGSLDSSGSKTVPWTIAYISLATTITIISIVLTLQKRQS